MYLLYLKAGDDSGVLLREWEGDKGGSCGVPREYSQIILMTWFTMITRKYWNDFCLFSFNIKCQKLADYQKMWYP